MAVADISDLLAVYLIFGSEDLLLDQAVERLKRRLSDVADLEYNMQVFDGDIASADEIIAAANTMPFMSDKRLVIVRRADKMAASDLGVLADYAGDPNPTTALVLVAEKMAKNLRIYKAVAAKGGAHEYKPPSKREFPATVVSMFAARGRKIGLDAAEVLVRAVGYDLRRLAIEIEKVVAFAGDSPMLSRSDIEQVMSTTASTSVFDLLDAVGSRNCREAVRLLGNLLGEGESVFGVHAMLLRHIRQLLQIRALLDRPEGVHSQEAIAAAVGMSPWQARNLMRQASRFEAGELVDALRAAAMGEAQMKTSRDSRLVLELWLISVCG